MTVGDRDLAAMRAAYGRGASLDEADVANGWAALLRSWIAEADSAGVVEPNAMTLATVDAAGLPDARTVLCKAVQADGVVFFSNYGSDKAAQLAARPAAALVFTWPAIERQVRVRGAVARVAAAETVEYWRHRPRGSQLGAWASAQSRPIGGRAELERALMEVTDRFRDVTEIPVPPEWGGYLVAAEVVEFWQGRENRLHNRIRMARADDGTWTVERLQP